MEYENLHIKRHFQRPYPHPPQNKHLRLCEKTENLEEWRVSVHSRGYFTKCEEGQVGDK